MCSDIQLWTDDICADLFRLVHVSGLCNFLSLVWLLHFSSVYVNWTTGSICMIMYRTHAAGCYSDLHVLLCDTRDRSLWSSVSRAQFSNGLCPRWHSAALTSLCCPAVLKRLVDQWPDSRVVLMGSKHPVQSTLCVLAIFKTPLSCTSLISVRLPRNSDYSMSCVIAGRLRQFLLLNFHRFLEITDTPVTSCYVHISTH